jgi:hypothetical protein
MLTGLGIDRRRVLDAATREEARARQAEIFAGSSICSQSSALSVGRSYDPVEAAYLGGGGGRQACLVVYVQISG